MAQRGPSDRELGALRDIADILIPENFNIYGFNKETVTDGVLKSISDVPIIGLKMRMIFKILKKCYE